MPICERVFENTKGCEYVPPKLLPAVGGLVNWTFHGKRVISSPRLEAVFDKWRDKM